MTDSPELAAIRARDADVEDRYFTDPDISLNGPAQCVRDRRTLRRMLDEARAQLAKERGGWDAFTKLRKSVAEARYPGMTGIVTTAFQTEVAPYAWAGVALPAETDGECQACGGKGCKHCDARFAPKSPAEPSC